MSSEFCKILRRILKILRRVFKKVRRIFGKNTPYFFDFARHFAALPLRYQNSYRPEAGAERGIFTIRIPFADFAFPYGKERRFSGG